MKRRPAQMFGVLIGKGIQFARHVYFDPTVDAAPEAIPAAGKYSLRGVSQNKPQHCRVVAAAFHALLVHGLRDSHLTPEFLIIRLGMSLLQL
jgi:hypothetical protein